MTARVRSLVISGVVIVAALTMALVSGGSEPGGPRPSGGPTASPGDPSTGSVPPAGACDGPDGPLVRVAPDTYVSDAGLSYPPDPGPFASRADHVLAHTADDLSRPLHGVFEPGTDRCGVFDVVDEAWTAIRDGRALPCGDGCHDIDLGRVVGVVGGTQGAAAGNPSTSWVRVILAGDDVITAYPIVR